jgi:hypothetical protein
MAAIDISIIGKLIDDIKIPCLGIFHLILESVCYCNQIEKYGKYF